MGVRGFLSYVKPKLPLIRPEEIEPPLRIGVDTHGLLYIWQDNLQILEKFLLSYLKSGHTLIFVFDGEAPAEKKEYLREKRKNREKAGLQAHALSQFLESPEGKALDLKSREHLERTIQGLKSSMWCITPKYRDSVHEILENHGCIVIQAKGEADEELVNMEKKKEIDVILSSDMDYVRFGVNRLWIPKFKGERFEVYDFDIPILCNEEDITIENLAEIAILCGSEYETNGISAAQAFGLLRYYGSLKNLAQRQPEFAKFLQN